VLSPPYMPGHSIPLDFITIIIFGEEYLQMKIPMQFSITSTYSHLDKAIKKIMGRTSNSHF
jgi:hypothetical protein